MRYQHRFRVRAPIEAVADFHSRSASMAAITPPPIIVRVHRAPEIQRDGDEMDFTMWMVGDSIFPGQSTAAVALGGLRVATSVLRDMQVTSLAVLDTQAQGRTNSSLRSCTLETTEGA